MSTNPCEECAGKCCYLIVTPTEEDIKLLSSSLGMSKSDFRTKYMDSVEFKSVFKAKFGQCMCVFIQDDGKCSVYEHRPRVCRKFLCKTIVDWMRDSMQVKH